MRFFRGRRDKGGGVPPEAHILETMVVPAFVLDRDRRVVLWNKAAEELTGVPAARLLNTRDHWRAFYDQPRPCLADLFFADMVAEAKSKNLYAVQLNEGQKNARRAENWCNMPMLSQKRYLILDASAILDAHGQVVAVIETLRDTTAEQEAKATLQKERDEQSQQVAGQLTEACSSLGAALSALANGDLTCKIEKKLPGAIDQLREDFNAAVDQLQSVLSQTVAASSTIRAGTGNIATTADDLSRRTEQQAASLEETAAALSQIMTTVRRTADGATHAREVVGATKTNAEQSGQIVRDAVDTMNGVARSSNKINQIIGVIDEIAFQTNLLALNAGVEAARAGEAGRGFAVVASEVRALAQRSAEAAKEIKSLISESSNHVNRGVHLVGLTGEALEKIIANIADISNVVAEIAASALEQATGLNEINTAVSHMDRVTQQNAGIVQQAATISQEMVRETAGLDLLMNRFQLGHERGPSAARHEAPARRLVRAR
ncbi:MAG: methyl-accepting chemotaxis protein [Beijerinckiaceae bacterium]|nr:methyl-accepting chemotaxis protein [Beijerinckiaceae bacterium]